MNVHAADGKFVAQFPNFSKVSPCVVPCAHDSEKDGWVFVFPAR